MIVAVRQVLDHRGSQPDLMCRSKCRREESSKLVDRQPPRIQRLGLRGRHQRKHLSLLAHAGKLDKAATKMFN
ncbi:hypothetical protein XACLG97_10780005 [Xanthomonas citri pv. citri]|nr:hypothetical protein XACLG97_10780005 [Xanthomonas citri pv. citri]CEH39227.1 hypothetical protein XACG102_10590032 [Xanthomonas citri pv. citri]